MKIAYKHLLEFLEDKPSIDDLSDKLFQLGHENEIENSIIDIEFTPNRGDCLSLNGLIRDLNVFYKTNFLVDTYEHEIPHLDIDFINNATEQCPYISFLNIEIDRPVSKYKDYLENYFKDLNINKTNFFTDVSNYIAYELGQPTHCYDYSTLTKDIILEVNDTSQEFKTLLGKSISLSKNDLVFTSNKNIINLAGVIGGNNSSCSRITKNVLVECAYFKPESIIGKAVKYDLNSDASHKFERGVDPACHDKVLRRFIQIVSEHTEITRLELCNFSRDQFKEIELDIDLKKVNSILGMDISISNYKSILGKLGFKINSKILVPSFRNDISHQNDLSEEIARVIGYDNIPPKKLDIPSVSKKYYDSPESKLKSFLINNGFTEVINSTFCKENELKAIQVDNPLDSNRNFLRTSISNSLIGNAIYNEKRQKDIIKLFEISDIYSSDPKSFSIKKKIALLVSGRRGNNYKEFSQSLNKKYLIDLFNKIGIDILDRDILNIDRSKINSKVKTPIFVIELSIDSFLNKINYNISESRSLNYNQYKQISEFPSSSRDISLSITDYTKIDKVIDILSSSSSHLLKDSFLFDFYINNKKSEIKVGYRFIFQSFSKTLTDHEIEKELNHILIPIFEIDKVSIPGFKSL